ncbi:MAG: hypothetical protein QGG36_23635 [Pirellulaceae bacterium]|nr:hypothetical protein [Pirellulaceae bacterium]
MLSDYGSEGMVAAIETLMNEAMKLELAEALMTRTAELVWSM